MKTFRRRASLFLTLMLGAFVLVPATRPAAQSMAGHLDVTFGMGGIVTLDLNGADDEAAALLIQPDGKICVAGRDGATSSMFAVVRYLADGRLDAGFGDGGKVRMAILGAFNYATAMARTPDGGLIVGGDMLLNDGRRQLALVRLNAAGQLDTSFGQFGKLIGPLDDHYATVSTHLQKVVVQTDGKLLVAGLYYFFTGSVGSPFLYRLQADGSRDPSFFGGGYADDLLIQPDGKIVGAESFGDVERLNPDGRIDLSFGDSSGAARTSKIFSTQLMISPAIALTLDSKIILACSLYRPRSVVESDFVLLRLNSNGALDASFGTNGVTIVDVATNDRVKDIVVQADGKILLAGYTGVDDPNTRSPLQARVALLRFNADGSLDEGFKADPLPADPLGFAVANAIALQADGRIVIAGGVRNSGGADMLVARYESGLMIPPPPVADFSVTAEPATVTGARGSKVSFKLIIRYIGDFHDGLFVGFPEIGATKVNVVSVNTAVGSSTLTYTYTLKIKGKAPAGTYPILLQVSDSTGRMHTATATLIIT